MNVLSPLARPRVTEATWPLLRAGLLDDLDAPTAADLAQTIGYPDVGHLDGALRRAVPPSDDLMAALLRHWLVLPALYFIDRDPGLAQR